METVDVAIVGGGPVGVGLAIDLGQRGIKVAVFERHEHLHHIPKGQNLTQRTGEHFQAWNVYEQMKQAVRTPGKFGPGGVTTYDTLLSKYHYDWLIRSDVSKFYAASNMRIPQYGTEAVLRERAAQLGNVSVHLGQKVTHVENLENSVELKISAGDTTKSISARYVVGCDGARSIVREQTGISQTTRTRFRRMVLAVFRSDELDTILERFPGKSYFNALSPDKEGYWQFFGRVEMGTFFFHTTVPTDSTLENLDLGHHFARAIGKPIEFETEYVGFWDLRIAVADTYRNERTFIAGDAAHSHPPYGGYGVNNGFEDIRNLSWKLEAMLKGWGSQALLDSYSEERQPAFVSTADDFIARMIDSDFEFVSQFSPQKDIESFKTEWSKRAELTTGEVNRYCPNYSGSPRVVGGSGPCSAIGDHRHQARPGYLLSPQGDLMDKLGSGFNLISVGQHAHTIENIRAQAGAIGMPLTVVEMVKSPETAQWEEEEILLRPDRFVAATGKDLADPHILQSILGRT